MKYIGDIELINGKIINCKVDPVTSLPEFVVGDESRLIYNLDDKQLYYNDGEAYRPLQVASENSQPLIQTLGNVWINPDYSFNPVPFNDLAFISGLTANDSLFTVIEKIDQALLEISIIDLNDIQDFNIEDPQAGDIVYFDGLNWINVSLSEIPDFAINISLGGLNDVDLIAIPTDNETIFFSSENNKFINMKWTFRYENLTPNVTHVVTHNLGQTYCAVTVINTNTNTLVTPDSVIFNNGSQLTVNLSSTLPVIILVTTIPIQNP
jgi:hypothetical protein